MNNNTNGNNNGNGLRRLQGWLSIALSLFAVVKVVFFAGENTRAIDDHLKYSDARIDRLEVECARGREIEIRLSNMKEEQRRLEVLIDRQSAQIEELIQKRERR